MPQLYSNAVITDAGLALLDKAQAGTASIHFTRMATGSGTYTTDEKISSVLRKSTGLKSEENSYPLSSVSVVPDGGVKLSALITNQDPATGEVLVSEGYHINEIGLYAKEKDGDDSTEVLYSITVPRGDNGDYMPSYGIGAPVQIVQEYHAKTGNAIEVTISSAGAVMLVEDAQREFEKLKEMIGDGGSIEGKALTFDRAKERENIDSGETLDTILGKIEKNLADLKRIAFTGSYADLVDAPDIPTIPDSLPASDVTSSYSATGTDPVNGKAIAGALKTLDVASKGGTGKYIQSISETDGKIEAVEADMPTIPTIPSSLPANGGNADSVGGKNLSYIMDYDNLTNAPDTPTASSLGIISTQATVTLTTAWSGDAAPYSQTIKVPGVTADSIVDIDVVSTVTAEQLDAYINAKIVDGGQGADTITLKAFGEKPAIAIPIKIVVRKV